MRATFIHILRYLGWALIGAALGLVLLRVWGERGEYISFSPVLEVLELAAILGALALVLIRVVVGAVSSAESAEVDRLTAVGLGRCVLGGVAGWWAAGFVYGFVTPPLGFRLNQRGWWVLPLVLAGAYAGVATGWLAWRRHGRILLPVAWALVFGLLVTGWLSLSKELMHYRVRLVPEARVALIPAVVQATVAVPSPTPVAASERAQGPLPSSGRGPQAAPPAQRRAAA